VQRAALRICFKHFLPDPQSALVVKTSFADLNISALRILMEEASNPQFLKRRLGIAGGAVSQDQDYLDRHSSVLKIKEPLEYPIVVDTVLANLLNADANVSAAALDALRKVKGVEKRQDFQTAMKKLQRSTNPRLKLSTSATLSPRLSPFWRGLVRTERPAFSATPVM
jgi:hypothetical protein